jgi:chromosome segregation ATPase
MPQLHIGSSTALAVLTLLVSVPAVQAQVARSGGGGSANPQLVQQYEQVLAERTQLKADNDQLKKQLDAAQQELAATKRKLTASSVGASQAQALQAQLTASQASLDSSKKALDQIRARMQELIARFRDTIDKTRAIEVERNKLQQQLFQTSAALDKAADRNVQMFQINAQLLDRLQHRGVFNRLTKAEPFTQIQRTRLDNLVLEDQERVDALHVQKEGTAAGAAAASASGGSSTGTSSTSTTTSPR